VTDIHKRIGKVIVSIYIPFALITAGFVGLLIFEGIMDEGGVEAAQTIIVDAKGDGNYTTIQDAINASKPGDTIYIWSGTYYENIVVNRTVTLIGNGTAFSAINGGGSGDVVTVTADWVNITGLTITNSGSDLFEGGIKLVNVQNCYIYNNVIRGNYYYSIRFENSHQNTIKNNNAFATRWSFWLSSSDGNTLEDNTLSNCGIAFYFSDSTTTILKNNVMSGCGIYMVGYLIAHFASHSIDTTNTVNGKPVYYWKNRNGGTVPAGAGQVILGYCTNVNVENQIVNDGSVGIILGYSWNNIISNNIAKNNKLEGMILMYSYSNTISDNNVSQNGDYGIRLLDYSHKNKLLNNSFISNGNIGIVLAHSNENIVKNNTCLKNPSGMSIVYSQSNTIVENNCNNNNEYGINLGSSTDIILDDNIIKSNMVSGIELFQSPKNIIRNNKILLNENGIRGWYSDEQHIENNIISNNIEGICLGYSGGGTSNNLIIKNEISYNSNTGFLMAITTNNEIYHNNIISNGVQVKGNSGNKWENDNHEGNYWSDYLGSDNGYGGRPSGDGIGDNGLPHPYSDQGDGYYQLDYYPFVNKTGWEFPVKAKLDDPGDIDTDGKFTLDWNEPIRAKGYILEEDTAPDFNTAKIIYSGPNIWCNIEKYVNETFYYRVKTYNDKQVGQWSNTVDITVDYPPAPPSKLVAKNPTFDEITLSWEPNTEPDINGYNIFINDTESGPTGNFHPIHTVLGSDTTYKVGGLKDALLYHFKIKAFDKSMSNSSYSNVASTSTFDLTPPKAPSGLNVIDSSPTTLTLTWNPNPEPNIIGYLIYRSKSSLTPFEQITPEEVNDTEYTDTELPESTTYYYKITAVNNVDITSDYSDIVFGTTAMTPYPPEINITFGDIVIPEDNFDNHSINLLEWFVDKNKDPLTFRYEDDNHITVKINKATGTVVLRPEHNWNGNEVITFYASDGDNEISDSVNIVVTPENDPPAAPEIKSPEEGSIIKERGKINFKGVCLDPDLPYGDKLTYAWTSNITGVIGIGDNITSQDLTVGTHLITLEVIDKSKKSSQTSIIIKVIPRELLESGDSTKQAQGNDAITILVIGTIVILIILLFAFFMMMKKKKELAEKKKAKMGIQKKHLKPKPIDITSMPKSVSDEAVIEEQPHIPILSEQDPRFLALPRAIDSIEDEDASAFVVDGGPKPVSKKGVEHDFVQDRVVETLDVETATADLRSARSVERPERSTVLPYKTKRKPDRRLTAKIDENREILESLEKLGQLKAKGILSEEEFQKKKADLLK
jgi:parallel beta-helix repeat protein